MTIAVRLVPVSLVFPLTYVLGFRYRRFLDGDDVLKMGGIAASAVAFKFRAARRTMGMSSRAPQADKRSQVVRFGRVAGENRGKVRR